MAFVLLKLATMRFATAAVLLFAALSSRAARADGVYFSEGFGTGAVRNELSNDVDSGTFRLRVAAGYKAGHWATEVFLAPEFMANRYGNDPIALGYGIDLKRIQPVSQHVSLYLRGSMSRMVINDTVTAVYDAPPCIDWCGGYGSGLDGASGRGLGVGVGAQISGKVPVLGLLAWPLFFTNYGPKMTGGVFLEDSYDFYRLQKPGGGTVDASITRWTFGVSAGSDF
ncbi:MAG: hypothetical protein K8W52_36480 [Deltaproteobacteria bacterium]|nr:hypothetical protein [Deltaproteobacteria bacterium]